MNGPPNPDDAANRHEYEIEQHEAYEYWGYLFKEDKTGTDRLKSLLRGLKDVVNKQYEPSENPDLTPTQLASFYRELNGDYNQLFLGTPSAALAFIYKSLGCLHSLQPLPHSQAFTEPTIPALKTEGWIMWQTIQLLLAPEEHSSFLMDAVKRWDVIDASTGEVFPKILPRQCFPLESDKHMVAWYEGVSERLRQEAEEEQRQRDLEAQQAEVKRIHNRRRDDDDDRDSVDSRVPAIAYFRNPLYRHVDGPYAGRPSIVRRSSKRPAISPRPTMVDKGKEAATSVGHVIRNMASPNLWDGGRSHGHSSGGSRSRERRRRSVQYGLTGEPPPSASERLSPRPHSIHAHDRRRSSSYGTRPGAEDEWEQSEASMYSPPRPGANPRQHSRASQDVPPESHLRHSRSHEPAPPEDYFEGYDNSEALMRRRNSAYGGETPTPTMAPNGFGPSFNPSASPLFASHVAKNPQPMPPIGRPPSSQPPSSVPPPPGDSFYNNRLRKSSSLRRPQGRYDSPNPPRSRDRYDSPRRQSRYDDMGPPPGHRGSAPGRYDSPNAPPVGYPQGHRESAGGRFHSPNRHSRYDSPNSMPMGHRNSAGRRSGGGGVGGGDYYMPQQAPITMPDPRRRNSGGRRSGSDLSGRHGGGPSDVPPDDYDEGDDGREPRDPPRRPKVTRFITPVSGVDGRKYPDVTPWRS